MVTELYYRAIDAAGTLYCGTSLARDSGTLRQELEERGLQLVRLRQRHRWRRRLPWHRSAGSGVLITMTFHLSHLLAAGVPMIDALDQLVALEPRGSLRSALCGVRDRVARGQSLSDALSSFPELFGDRYLACVRAGEVSGELPGCLARLESSLRWQQGVSRRLKNLMIYPALAASVLVLVVGFLFAHVVPKLGGFLLAVGESPSWQTRSALQLSSLLVHHGATALSALAGLIFILMILAQRSEPVQLLLHRLLLGCGVTGRLQGELLLARYAETVGMLLHSGVALLDSLAIGEVQVSNRWMRRELIRARLQVLDGASLAQAMICCRHMPSALPRLVAAGESAGALADALMRAGDQLHLGARHSLDRIEALLPSVLLGIIGLLLLWVIAAVIVPVYNLLMLAGGLP